MDYKKLFRWSGVNLFFAYFLSFLFLVLVVFFKAPTVDIAIAPTDFTSPQPERIIQTSESNVTFFARTPAVVYQDHLDTVVLNKDGRTYVSPEVLDEHLSTVSPVIHGDSTNETTVYSTHGLANTSMHPSHDFLHGRRSSLSIDNEKTSSERRNDSVDLITFEEAVRGTELTAAVDTNIAVGLDGDDVHSDGLDLSKLAPVSDAPELGETDFTKGAIGDGYGGGKLYAYNFPSRGLGAGVGNSSLGASIAAGAGLGAGIGEASLNGSAVPALGGVGSGPKAMEGESSNAMPSDGVAGLVGGAGAGGAAGLTNGYMLEDLGIGMGKGIGSGGNGAGRDYDYAHLPKDGALHIMMHVDGSGSILNTRKQLEIMKDTLLKTALLPYYNNDPSLYEKRVTIVSDAGERTLNFFTQASQKNNVLAIAFQDEAQPVYHLPNFNTGPADIYSQDLSKLKSSLSNHKGIYRGVMFQVDRGKTFAKSFKEFVGNAFRGEGYLTQESLKKYHRDENLSNIKNKEGIVFSDEYHAKDKGTPEYYLDLLFKASEKVGLDLNIYKGGLTDGKYIKTN